MVAITVCPASASNFNLDITASAMYESSPASIVAQAAVARDVKVRVQEGRDYNQQKRTLPT